MPKLEEIGESASGAAIETPLLLLPGTLCDERVFAPVIDRLGGCETIVGDMTGARTTPDLARKLLETAPLCFSLAGFSLGGIVALEMVAQAPRRIARLALIDTTPRPDPPANASLRREAVADATANGMDGYVLESWDRLVAPSNRGREDLKTVIVQMARDGGPSVLDDQSEVAIHRADSRPRLGDIHVPTLVLAGAHEQVCPIEAHREIAHGIVGSAFHLVPDAGHFAPLENPEAVALHLRQWLAVRPRGTMRDAL